MLEKLTSRKFLISALSMVASIAGALVGLGGNVGTICCVIGAIITPLIYVLTEGSIDKKAVQLTEESIEEIIEIINKQKETEKAIAENTTIIGEATVTATDLGV